MPRSASPAVIRWAAQMAERQEPPSWEAGRRALLGAATQMAETTELKMAVEASIHTAIAALPECTLCEGDEPFECSLCLDMVEAGERVRTLAAPTAFTHDASTSGCARSSASRIVAALLCNANPIEAHVSPQTSRGSRRGPSGNGGGGESGGAAKMTEPSHGVECPSTSCFRADYYTPRKQSTPAPRPTPRPGAQSHRSPQRQRGRALRAEGRVGVVRGRNLCAEARSVCCFADADPLPLEHMRGRGS